MLKEKWVSTSAGNECQLGASSNPYEDDHTKACRDEQFVRCRSNALIDTSIVVLRGGFSTISNVESECREVYNCNGSLAFRFESLCETTTPSEDFIRSEDVGNEKSEGGHIHGKLIYNFVDLTTIIF